MASGGIFNRQKSMRKNPKTTKGPEDAYLI